MGSIRWLGHSGFEIALANRILLTDPWLTDNPLTTMKASEIEKTDVVCVTHDHKIIWAMRLKFVNELERPLLAYTNYACMRC